MNTYVTSDLNFCNGFKDSVCSTEQEWNDFLINKWNSVVAQEDTVYILGGFGQGQIKVIQDILSALNGTKLLLYNDTVKQYSRKMWEHIGLPAIHYTLFSLDKKLHYNYNEKLIKQDNDSGWLICYGGGKSKPIWSHNGLNVSAELWDYCPLDTNEIHNIWNRMSEWENIENIDNTKKEEKEPIKLKFSNL